jgi:hypothetical protein
VFATLHQYQSDVEPEVYTWLVPAPTSGSYMSYIGEESPLNLIPYLLGLKKRGKKFNIMSSLVCLKDIKSAQINVKISPFQQPIACNRLAVAMGCVLKGWKFVSN